jgi:hypothetical protein
MSAEFLNAQFLGVKKENSRPLEPLQPQQVKEMRFSNNGILVYVTFHTKLLLDVVIVKYRSNMFRP